MGVVMTEINHEKRNRLGKVGPAFDNFRDNDPTGRKGQFLNQIAIEEVGVGPTIRKRKEQEREEQRKQKKKRNEKDRKQKMKTKGKGSIQKNKKEKRKKKEKERKKEE